MELVYDESTKGVSYYIPLKIGLDINLSHGDRHPEYSNYWSDRRIEHKIFNGYGWIGNVLFTFDNSEIENESEIEATIVTIL